MNFFKLSKLFRKQVPRGTGALLDIRSIEEKQKDYLFKEIVAAADPVTWIEKAQSAWRKFPIFDQDGSGSCVAQTVAKLMGIMYFLKNSDYVHFSATHIYQRRANKPSLGMWATDAFDIARKGVTLEELLRSQKLTDAEMDKMPVEFYKEEVGQIFKLGNYVTLPERDIETVASTIQKTKKAVMVWFFFKYDEWTDEPKINDPSLNVLSPGVVRHSVAAVDYFLKNGKKCLLIEDSWGPQYGLGGQRIITEDFYKARNYFAGYPINFKFEETKPEPVPHYEFAKTLVFSITDPDVEMMQIIFQKQGIFPENVDTTGYYGSITAKAVLAFQRKYQVAPEAELVSLGGKVVGPKTLAKLNEIQ